MAIVLNGIKENVIINIFLLMDYSFETFLDPN